jgi:integrase
VRINRLCARCGRGGSVSSCAPCGSNAACDLPHIRLHDIRHSYATASLKANVNPKIVSQRLGHASVGFTLSVYSHALPGIDRDAADTIADLILREEDDPDEVG